MLAQLQLLRDGEQDQRGINLLVINYNELDRALVHQFRRDAKLRTSEVLQWRYGCESWPVRQYGTRVAIEQHLSRHFNFVIL